ncbi:hypothetical protein SCHPADRAFT_581317 [Schizopora paradoxa]|uniref:Uncharacterized protein n=1 Tax=Schizopora paradoxa TaxID=27342 RepID=A0A0H2RC75_9AGAM|nr:hypothetical protein SCHPADRAFT_581317 [Schizopora paradoxa]
METTAGKTGGQTSYDKLVNRCYLRSSPCVNLHEMRSPALSCSDRTVAPQAESQSRYDWKDERLQPYNKGGEQPVFIVSMMMSTPLLPLTLCLRIYRQVGRRMVSKVREETSLCATRRGSYAKGPRNANLTS